MVRFSRLVPLILIIPRGGLGLEVGSESLKQAQVHSAST